MKLAVLCLVAVGLAIVAAGSCSVNHVSEDFVCDAEHRCASDRTCVDGFCVLIAGDAGVHDGLVFGDAAVCPSQCTSCVIGQKSCTIDCSLNGGCKQQVTCPVGWSCNVLCNAAASCERGISCVGSTSCTISCTSAQSCQNVSCGAGPCKVDCGGTGSCQGVSCGLSCACDVICHINSACDNLTCKKGCTSGLGCTSLGQDCGCQ